MKDTATAPKGHGGFLGSSFWWWWVLPPTMRTPQGYGLIGGPDVLPSQSPLWDYGAPRSVPPRRGKSCLSFSSITHPNLHGDPLYSSVWLHEEGGQLQRDLPHDVTVTMETNIPGVPVDSGHHEHGPAQPVPRIHVGTFQQQPAQKRDTGQKRYRSRERCQSEGWRGNVPSRGKAEYCTSHTARPNGKS